MAYAILRTSKLKSFGNIAGSGAHTYREQGMAPNADPVRMGKNSVLVGSAGDVLGDVKSRVHALTEKPRANAVLCIEYLLSASPEFFDGLSEKQINFWAQENIDFLKNKHGSENVTHAVLHLDESTPHIVAYVVPESKGKLNCRDILGGRDKLKKLQTDYAESMKKMGLQRGVEGSKATHKTVKSFYASLNDLEKKALKKFNEIKEPTPFPNPSLKSLISQEKRDEDLNIWKRKEMARTGRLIKGAGEVLTANQTLKEDVGILKQKNSSLEAENERLKNSIVDLREMLDLPKDVVSSLRKLDVSMVAEKLGHFDEILKGENAIDLVKRVGEFNYQEAVSWLHHEFGAAVTTVAVREDMETKKPVRPFTKAENVMRKAVHQQLEALGCDKYRISLIGNDTKSAPYLPGKTGKNDEQFYTKKEVENLVPYLRYENNVGQKSIFITPMDDNAFYVLLDDMRLKLQELGEKQFQPCIVQKTSWESLQAVFKIPKTGINRRAVIDVFNSMNKAFGDVKITGLRHPFRLAGFRNFKAKHGKEGRFPFVELVQKKNIFCRKTLQMVMDRQREIEQDTTLKESSSLENTWIKINK